VLIVPKTLRKETIIIYGPHGEELSEVTRNVKDDLLKITKIDTSFDIIQKKPEFELDTLSIPNI